MKKPLLIFLTFLCTYISFAGVTSGFGYQAVVRDAFGNVIFNQPVSMRFSIHDGSPLGALVFQQTDTVVPNQFGIITVIVGGGSISNSLDSVNWGSGGKFMQVETDVTGGVNYTDMGTTQLLSVPYALYAENSGSSTPGPQGVTGAKGDTGADGAAGPQGPAGADGVAGAQGATGPQGATGVQGAQGLQGPAGLNGAAGIQGATGAKGDTGADGAAGPQGPAGADGVAGAQGATGPQGATGVQGAQGLQGPAGLNGAAGIQGATGAKGDTGADGAVGPQGFIGTQGATGPQGLQGMPGMQGATGAQGDMGPMGPQGLQGTPGVSITGPIGVTGPMGPVDTLWTRSSTTGQAYTTGKVGINQPNPQSDLDVNGFTKLGSSSPAMQVMPFAGVVSSSAGGSTTVPLGIPNSKIMSAFVVVDESSNLIMPSTSNNILSGYEYSYVVNSGNLVLKTTLLNSGNILNKSFRAFVIYTP